MKSPSTTPNCRRTKTNPDHHSLLSYSTTKSAFSSEKRASVKAACKVLCEMREDESSKLAMRFTQLQIVLGTQSIVHLLQKYRSAKLQTYYWVLKQNSHGQCATNATSNRSVQLSHYDTKPGQQSALRNNNDEALFNVLKNVIQKKQMTVFQIMKNHHQILKGTIKLSRCITQKKVKLLYTIILAFSRSQQNKIIYKTSILEQDDTTEQQLVLPESQSLKEEFNNTDEEEGITIKELLAIKFASITILTAFLKEKSMVQQFRFMWNLKYQYCHQSNQFDCRQFQPLRDQLISNINGISNVSTIRGADQLLSTLLLKLRSYFKTIVQANIEEQSSKQGYSEANSRLVLYATPDVSDLIENDQSQQQLRMNGNLKRVISEEFYPNAGSKVDSLNEISDVEDTKQYLMPKKSMIFQKQKKPSNFIRVIRQYCNEQVQLKSKVPEIQRVIEITIPQQSFQKNRRFTLQIGIILLALLLYLILK